MLKQVELLKKQQQVSHIMFTSGNQRTEAISLYQKLGFQKKDSSLFIKL